MSVFMPRESKSVGDDPSDWPKDLPELRILDNLLRCSICYEYFVIAMMVPGCCHNYCSLCIRKHLTYKKQCPSCPQDLTESQLKCNRVLDELVKMFTALRPKLLKLIREHSSLKNKIEIESKRKKSLSPKDLHQKKTPSKSKSSVNEKTPGKQRNLSSSSPVEERSTPVMPIKNSLLSSLKKRTHSHVDDDDDEIVFLDNTSRCIPQMEENSSSNTNLTTTDSKDKTIDKADCPVCGRSVPLPSINSHLDNCLSKPTRSRTRKSRVKVEDVDDELPCSSQPRSKRLRRNLKTTSTNDMSAPENNKNNNDERNCGKGRKKNALNSMKSVTVKKEPTFSSDKGCLPCSSALPVEQFACNFENSQIRFDPQSSPLLFDEESPTKSADKINSPKINSPQINSPKINSPKTASNEFIQSKTASRRKPLPSLIYTALTEKQLRKKLKESGLSSKGDKKCLIKRLQEFTLLYNSQCDAVDPMPVDAIIRDIERSEAIQTRLGHRPQTVIHTFDRSKTEKEREQFDENYLATHKDHFESLIQDVQSRKNEKGSGQNTTKVLFSSDSSTSTCTSTMTTNEMSPPVISCEANTVSSFNFGTPNRPIMVEDSERLDDDSQSLLTSPVFTGGSQTPVSSRMNQSKSFATPESDSTDRETIAPSKTKRPVVRCKISNSKGQKSKGIFKNKGLGLVDVKRKVKSGKVSVKKISSYFGIKREDHVSATGVSSNKPSISPSLFKVSILESQSNRTQDIQYGKETNICNSVRSKNVTKIKQEDLFQNFCSSLNKPKDDDSDNEDDEDCSNKIVKELIESPPSPSSLDDFEDSMKF